MLNAFPKKLNCKESQKIMFNGTVVLYFLFAASGPSVRLPFKFKFGADRFKIISKLL